MGVGTIGSSGGVGTVPPIILHSVHGRLRRLLLHHNVRRSRCRRCRRRHQLLHSGRRSGAAGVSPRGLSRLSGRPILRARPMPQQHRDLRVHLQRRQGRRLQHELRNIRLRDSRRAVRSPVRSGCHNEFASAVALLWADTEHPIGALCARRRAPYCHGLEGRDRLFRTATPVATYNLRLGSTTNKVL
jgi:hypothetical protein